MAKHLSDLRDIEYEGIESSRLTKEQVKVIGLRYWWGPDISLEKVKSNLWYGNEIINNKELLEELIK